MSGLDVPTPPTAGEWGIRSIWKYVNPANLKRTVEDVCAWEQDDGVVGVAVSELWQSTLDTRWFRVEKEYRISEVSHGGTKARSALIVFDTRVEIPAIFDHVPRVGIGLALAPRMEDLEWFGRGLGENYIDRTNSTQLGVWNSTVTQQHFPFIPPSECGGHEDVRYVKVSAKDGRSLMATAFSPFHFDARHSSIAEYGAAMHDHEPPRHKETFLNLDVRHAGIGDNMAWSTVIDDAHKVMAGTYMFRFEVRVG